MIKSIANKLFTLLFALVASSALAAQDSQFIELQPAAALSDNTPLRATGGEAMLLFHPGSMVAFDFEPISASTTPASSADQTLQLIAPSGQLARFGAGNTPSLRLHLRIDSRQIDQLLTGRSGTDGVSIDWFDAQGLKWLQFINLHSQIDVKQGELRIKNADAMAGPALSTLLNPNERSAIFLGEGRVTMRLQGNLLPSVASSCAIPNWPTETEKADVALTDIQGIFALRCNGTGCDGPGADNPKVVIAPSAALENVGSKDVPWYQKFNGNFPPYGNDQHPMLVWNMYRIDDDGRMRQIGQSGVKHAFFTVNGACNCPAGFILGLQCTDIYGALTNDTPTVGDCTVPSECHQGPRSEILPRTAQWARCGSIYDGNCDGSDEDTVPYTSFEHRMVVDENELDSGIGERYFFESWYLVRDDGQIRNNIGSRTVGVNWVPPAMNADGRWVIGENAGEFQNGSALERKMAQSPPDGTVSRFSELKTPHGTVQIGSQARRFSANFWRYDYSVLNLDAALITTEGSEPNLRMLTSRGITRFFVALPQGATIANPRFLDADLNAANNWNVTRTVDGLVFSTPAADLRWGTLYSFGFDSNIAPAEGATSVTFGEEADAFSTRMLGPSDDQMLSDGFE
jgi:hypothetical protein